MGFSLIGEGDPAGEQHRCGFLCPAAIFVVTNQGKSPAGKLHPDLMAASCEEPNVHKTITQMAVLELGLFHSAARFLHHEHLVFPAVLEQ